MVDDKERSAEHYNKSARDLLLLPMQQKVSAQVNPKQNQWTPNNHHPDTHSSTAKII